MYQYILNSVIIPIGAILFRSKYPKYLKLWRSYDALSSADLKSLQNKNLTTILHYAKEHVPYYRSLNLKEGSLLSDFPILTKDLIRKHSGDLCSNNFRKEDLEKHHSSGSSGVQSFTYMTSDYRFKVLAIQTHWWEWGGFIQGDPSLQTGISPKRSFLKLLKDLFFKVEYVEAFTLNDAKIEYHLSRVRKKKKKHLVGYPSALHVIAQYLIKKGETIPFESLISHGDKLFDHYREAYKIAFENPKIVNTYGCAEGLMMACQIDLDYYYIMSPEIVIEIVDDRGTVLEDGEVGFIVVTGLTNFAMPLIRYRLGDMGIILPKNEYPATSRFNYPLLKKVIGRETDIITTQNGNKLTVHSFTGILEYYPEIKQYKVIQLRKNEVVIEYVIEDEKQFNSQRLERAKKELISLLGAGAILSFKNVQKISSSPSGKPQIIEIRC